MFFYPMYQQYFGVLNACRLGLLGTIPLCFGLALPSFLPVDTLALQLILAAVLWLKNIMATNSFTAAVIMVRFVQKWVERFMVPHETCINMYPVKGSPSRMFQLQVSGIIISIQGPIFCPILCAGQFQSAPEGHGESEWCLTGCSLLRQSHRPCAWRSPVGPVSVDPRPRAPAACI